MAIEYEAMFGNVEKEDIITKLESLGAVCVKPETLMKRHTFNLPGGEKWKWARVRDEGNKITMSYKALAGHGIECQKEVELTVDDFDSAVEFLSSVGCIKKAYQESRRQVWQLDGVSVMIDEWPFLEPLVEVEGESEAVVKGVSEKLGFDYSKAIFSSVDELYTQKYGVTEDQVVNKTPRIAFGDKNPFVFA